MGFSYNAEEHQTNQSAFCQKIQIKCIDFWQLKVIGFFYVWGNLNTCLFWPAEEDFQIVSFCLNVFYIEMKLALALLSKAHKASDWS